ncbi:uncharacterized protein BT62DRAFT_971227 [Guyanagaster necrorhizus]|uniref:Uncharacterized protein n=1 Tax=Guyanagaster necrorhizus TaxID=856835 RepID=A0A9P7VNK8_9AGAR|nr:uncharacterized protein BT62DRAFT_971227 [Guyanagaster necrorhizus MCA 3950]KAG7444493.1 hypothetical protein BT62DRAFT_971227 [Guyanagaster necrorhizus MCA 3950]
MPRPESYSNHGQDHVWPPILSKSYHHIFLLCTHISEVASCLPADTPNPIKRFCEIVLQKLPRDASDIKSFQTESFNSLLVDLAPITLEYKIDASTVEPPIAQKRRDDDERPGDLSTDINFSLIPLLEDLFDPTESSAAPFSLQATNMNHPSRSQPPFSSCFIPDDKVLGGSGKVIKVDRNGNFNIRASDESTHGGEGNRRTRPTIQDVQADQSERNNTTTFSQFSKLVPYQNLLQPIMNLFPLFLWSEP